MKTCIIYHSHSGTTRRVAESVKSACGGELVEVKLKGGHSSPIAYFLGLFSAMRKEYSPIEPASIDVSSADVVVIGTPVWARKATPAITAAIEAMTGSTGKKAIIFATCGNAAGNTLPLLAEALTAKGMHIAGEFVLTTQDLEKKDPEQALVLRVKETGAAP
jgi:flavodoxin